MNKKLARNVGRAYIGILIIVVLIVSAGVFGLWYAGKKQPPQTAGQIAVVTQSTLATPDSDNDGLPDWEEALWKTDPHKADTDGDGASDGEEVRLGRDPSKPGPDDTLPKEKVEVIAKAKEEATVPKTTLDTLALGFLENYGTLRNPGVPDVIKKGINGSIINSIEEQTAVKEYTVNDLAMVTNPSNTDINIYFSKLDIIFDAYYSDHTQDETRLLQSLLKTHASEDAKKIQDAAAVYKKVSDALLQTPVPKNLVPSHLVATNIFYGMHQSVLQMSEVLTDPLIAMVGLKNGEIYNASIVAYFQGFAEGLKQ